ncbi:MAG: SRPBCC family protein [Gemmatimonadaceae bacterium]
MLSNIIIVLAVLIVGLLVYAATRPNSFRVQRSTRIDAAPAAIFPHVNDFHKWSAWSPWEHLDPAMQRSHSGAASGKGAVYAWEGNKKVGKGRMGIIDSAPPARVIIKLDFLAPFEAHNTTEFTMVEYGQSTDVTWDMHGPSPFMSKLIGIFMNMDAMIGKDFERGLAGLKKVAEQRA